MVILHFITSLKIGGAETALYNLLHYWTRPPQEHGITHFVIYIYDGPYVDKIKKLGIDTFKLNGLVCPYGPIAFYRLIRIIQKLKPDLIHSALWSANIMAGLISIFSKIPVICDLHGDCSYHGFIRNFFTKTVARATARATARTTARPPAKFVAVSEDVKESFLKLLKNRKKIEKRTVVIRNGIDAKELNFLAQKEKLSRQDIKFLPNDFVIASVGRLHSVKKYDLLIRSFGQLVKRFEVKSRPLRLCLIGRKNIPLGRVLFHLSKSL